MALTLATATRNAQAAELGALLNGGTLKLYNGSRPASANTALSGQTLLATFNFANPAFGSPSGGVVTANAIADATPAANGTATWARLESSVPGTVVDASVSVTGGGGDVQISSTTIDTGVDISVTSVTITQPSGE